MSWWARRAGLIKLDRARAAVEKAGTGLVWSPNFSVGVSVFSQLVAEAARLLARQPEYGAWAWEIHHCTKKDAPSGTMLALVETMKKSGYDKPIDVAAIAPARTPVRMRSASIPPRTRSPFATRRAAAMDLRAALCARPAGWSGKRVFTIFAPSSNELE